MTTITRCTTNVFHDLGYPDASDRQLKTHLTMAINNVLKIRNLREKEAAALLGIAQPELSALKDYRLDRFSIETLVAFLNALDHEVEIMSRPHADPADPACATPVVQ